MDDGVGGAGINKTLDQFTYRDNVINELITESFYEVEFMGLKGLTKCERSGDPYGLVSVTQQQGQSVKTRLKPVLLLVTVQVSNKCPSSEELNFIIFVSSKSNNFLRSHELK